MINAQRIKARLLDLLQKNEDHIKGLLEVFFHAAIATFLTGLTVVAHIWLYMHIGFWLFTPYIIMLWLFIFCIDPDEQ